MPHNDSTVDQFIVLTRLIAASIESGDDQETAILFDERARVLEILEREELSVRSKRLLAECDAAFRNHLEGLRSKLRSESAGAQRRRSGRAAYSSYQERAATQSA